MPAATGRAGLYCYQAQIPLLFIARITDDQNGTRVSSPATCSVVTAPRWPSPLRAAGSRPDATPTPGRSPCRARLS